MPLYRGSRRLILRRKAITASSYVGPGDVASGAKFWYGLRAYSAAKAGTAAIRVIRASDSTQTDINTLANGSLDVATLTSFLTSTTGKIVTWYDQSGALAGSGSTNLDVTQATGASRASITLAALNGYPVAVFDGAASTYSSTNSLASAVAVPLTISMVADVTSAPAGLQQVISDNNGLGGITCGFTNTSTQSLWMYGGNTIPTLATSLNTWLSLQFFFNSPTGASFEQNGTTTGASSDPGSGPFGTGVIALGASAGNSTRFFGGNFVEGGLWAGSPTDLTSNQRAFWNF